MLVNLKIIEVKKALLKNVKIVIADGTDEYCLLLYNPTLAVESIANIGFVIQKYLLNFSTMR